MAKQVDYDTLTKAGQMCAAGATDAQVHAECGPHVDCAEVRATLASAWACQIKRAQASAAA